MQNITINDILYVVLTAAIPLILRYIGQYVSAKVANSKYEKAVGDVFTAVEYVNQTFVDALKQAGSFDEQAKVDAFTKAKDAALDIMDKATRNWLEKTHADVDEWLTIQIENAVKAAKVNG